MKTFPIGGVHPHDCKEFSKDASVEVMELADEVNIPLSQHIGAPAVVKVANGDKVLVGDVIAEPGGFMSAFIHAPVSGTVTAVGEKVNAQGIPQMMVTIRREGDDWREDIDRSSELVPTCQLDSKQIIEKIRQCGIVGLGGATFPTHVKLSIPAGKRAEFLIINGVECEPYLTSDYRTMMEYTNEVIVGIKILRQAVSAEHVLIGVENNKRDAMELLSKCLTQCDGIQVVPLKMKYPQGGEKQLIAALTGRQVPPPPALPIDVGAVVCNVSTAKAVYDAVQKNKPLVERVVTVSGRDVKQAKNMLVRFGTPVSKLLAKCSVEQCDKQKVLLGGPMMGRAMSNLDAPVTKGCSGVVVLTSKEASRCEQKDCIKCAKCVEACPMGLEPFMLYKLSKRSNWDLAEQEDIVSCIECGSCSFTCPGYLPLLDYIRLGKGRVMANIKARNRK
ncbi:MAG: electron transport complex subunit RsxC [Alistipes sp.]|nr:electron transport complex subunit RsxC [Candidatus Alistipes equi]